MQVGRRLISNFSENNFEAVTASALRRAFGAVLSTALPVLILGSMGLMPCNAVANDIERAPTISTRGEAKKIVIRNRYEVLQLRGARANSAARSAERAAVAGPGQRRAIESKDVS